MDLLSPPTAIVCNIGQIETMYHITFDADGSCRASTYIFAPTLIGTWKQSNGRLTIKYTDEENDKKIVRLEEDITRELTFTIRNEEITHKLHDYSDKTSRQTITFSESPLSSTDSNKIWYGFTKNK